MATNEAADSESDTGNNRNGPVSDGSESDQLQDDKDVVHTSRKRQPKKGLWAIEHFNVTRTSLPSASGSKKQGGPVWKLICKWCGCVSSSYILVL